MEEVDKGCLMIRMGVSGWVFLLVPTYPGSPGPKAVKRLCVCVCVCVVLSETLVDVVLCMKGDTQFVDVDCTWQEFNVWSVEGRGDQGSERPTFGCTIVFLYFFSTLITHNNRVLCNWYSHAGFLTINPLTKHAVLVSYTEVFLYLQLKFVTLLFSSHILPFTLSSLSSDYAACIFKNYYAIYLL